MPELFKDNLKNIKDFIEQKEKETPIWQINESLEKLWLDVKIWQWLNGDKDLLSYAEYFLDLKESWWFLWSIKMQFLELKLSVTCPYFKDFKVFLAELKKWERLNNGGNNDHLDKIWGTSEFMWTKISEIKSHPFYKNSKTWVTRCSATARFNAENFGLKLPSWDAYDAWKKPWKECLMTIPESKKDRR